MPPKSDSTEGIVLNFVNEQNRPLNVQNVADFLQKFNLKKTAVQKALDSLADSGKISFKEYGKQKIYIARQDQFDIPDNEELNRMKEENAKLQEMLDEQRREISEVEGEIKALQSNMTLEEIRARETNQRNEAEEMEKKLTKLREGVILVSPEERKAVEVLYTETINQWRRRKRMFKDIWDAITENSPKDIKEFKEELGIEYDEDVGVSLQSFADLMQQGKKRSRGQAIDNVGLFMAKGYCEVVKHATCADFEINGGFTTFEGICFEITSQDYMWRSRKRSWTDNWLLATTEPSKFQLIILNRDYHICLKNSELIHITAIGGNVDSRKERKWN
nr:homologous-pairing protein 2 homolog [Ipomoea batatas]